MDDANPMGPLAGVKPSDEIVLVPFNETVRVESPRLGAQATYVTYTQLAAWASAQAERFERIHPVEVRRINAMEFSAFFSHPGHPEARRGSLTREQAADLLRDGLPRHEVFPDKSLRDPIDAARPRADS